MTLSLQFGMPLAALLEVLTPAEWQLWVAYQSIHPFGPRQDDYRAGVIAAGAMNAWGGKVTPADLFPSLKPPPAKPGATDTGAFRAWAMARCPAIHAWQAAQATKRNAKPDGG